MASDPSLPSRQSRVEWSEMLDGPDGYMLVPRREAEEKLDIYREALHYLREHHLISRECLCDAARSVLDSALILGDQKRPAR